MKNIIAVLLFFIASNLLYSIDKDDIPSAEAEWHDARTVMLHIPGIEALFIEMFPIASGYTNAFNQIEAEREFNLLKDTLERFGVQVYTTNEILLNNVIDGNGQIYEGQQLFKLQHLTQEFLKIDLTNLKAPLPFDLRSYKNQIISIINPKNLIRLIFLNPTIHLFQESEYLISNNTLSPKFSVSPVSNFYYLNDLAITTSKGIIVGKLSNPQRRNETAIFKYLLNAKNITPVYEVIGNGRVEGGDFIPAETVCFIGQGLRTNSEGIKQLLKNKVFGTKTVIVVKDHLKYPYQMHLIKYFNFLNKNTVVFAKNRMKDSNQTLADVYEYSTKDETYRRKMKNISFVSYLRKTLQYTVIPVSLEDQKNLAMDYFVVKQNTIIAPEGVSSEYKQTLNKEGVNVVWLNVENIKSGHGGIHSVIKVLKRKLLKPTKSLKDFKSSNNSNFINL